MPLGRLREAFESDMVAGGRRPQYGRPASAAAIAAAEQALGLPLPARLRELYADFDGIRHLEVQPEVSAGRPMAPDNFDLYDFLPLRLLSAARDCLSASFGRVARSRIKGAVTLDAEGRCAAFERELCRCVAFSVWEGGATFHFMTDERAWGVGRGRVSAYDHNGGPSPNTHPLIRWLRGLGRGRSQGW